MESGSPIGIVSNIQHWTVHDGPGVRTEIFFKGCPLRCMWCSNPETIGTKPIVGVDSRNCIGVDVCGLCIEACEFGALLVADNKVVGIQRDLCKNCLSCAKACPMDTAMQIYGKKMTVDEVMAEILMDREIQIRTGGGVTLSGGDCLMQPEFVLALLKECSRKRIHTCVETELHCSTEVLDSILPYTDLLMTDIKHMDPAKHRKYTGVSNKRILANIRYAAMKNVPMVIRVPVVPGFNDDQENIKATAEFILKNTGSCLCQLQILPYRPLGLEKYRYLGMEYPMKDYKIPEPGQYLAQIRSLVKVFREYGIPAEAGTGVKIQA